MQLLDIHILPLIMEIKTFRVFCIESFLVTGSDFVLNYFDSMAMA